MLLDLMVERRSEYLILNDITVKQRILSVLITVMNGRSCDEDIIHQVFLTFNRYRVPYDLVCLTYLLCLWLYYETTVLYFDF